MGLREAVSAALQRLMRRLVGWQVPLFLGAAALAAACGGEGARLVLRWEREAIAAGELWRLVTGHLAHLGTEHLLLNLAGLCLVWLLVGRRLGPLRWWLVTALSMAAIDAGFWLLAPGLAWYVGLSGLLHALLVAGSVAGLREAPLESGALVLLVIGKVAVEQLTGPLPGSEAAAGGPVVVDAHLYGTVAGLLSGAALLPRRANGAATPI